MGRDLYQVDGEALNYMAGSRGFDKSDCSSPDLKSLLFLHEKNPSNWGEAHRDKEVNGKSYAKCNTTLKPFKLKCSLSKVRNSVNSWLKKSCK
jgi:hypothetical protein